MNQSSPLNSVCGVAMGRLLRCPSASNVVSIANWIPRISSPSRSKSLGSCLAIVSDLLKGRSQDGCRRKKSSDQLQAPADHDAGRSISTGELRQAGADAWRPARTQLVARIELQKFVAEQPVVWKLR